MARAPRISFIPLWAIGLTLFLSGVAATRLTTTTSEPQVMSAATFICVGIVTFLVGTGVRYLVLSGLVLNAVIAVIMGLLTTALLADLWQARQRLREAPADLQRELAEYEQIRLRFKDSPNAQDREDVRTKLPPAIARAKQENAKLIVGYRRIIFRNALGSLVLVLLALAGVWSSVVIGRFYGSLRLRPGTEQF